VRDVDLVVPDSSAEPAFLPALEAAGFELGARQPDWEQHRYLRGARPTSNVHVFSPGARESQRQRLFRDWLISWAATRFMVPCSLPSSARNVRTIRTAEAFSSSEYRRVVGLSGDCSLGMAPSSFPRSGASTGPRASQTRRLLPAVQGHRGG
jgi:hypothetical protein